MQQLTRVISALLFAVFVEWLVALDAYAEGRGGLAFLGVWLADPSACRLNFGVRL